MRYLIMLILSFSISSGLFAQKFIRETRNTFTSFGTKITKVVIPSTTLADMVLRDAVNKGWRISPFEFCDSQEYEALKNDTSYFFLMRVDGRFKNELEPKIEYLTLIQGGPEVKRGTYSNKNIVTLPVQETGDVSGANLHLIPIYIDIIQNHIYKIQNDVSLAFKGNLFYADKVTDVIGRDLLIASELLSYTPGNSEISDLFKGKAKLVSEEDVEDAIIGNKKNTVVTVLIKPRGNSRGSYCYKMLVSTDSHELLFFRRHKISLLLPAGFTKEDIRKISVPFQF
jgi:hypothetical protein